MPTIPGGHGKKEWIRHGKRPGSSGLRWAMLPRVIRALTARFARLGSLTSNIFGPRSTSRSARCIVRFTSLFIGGNASSASYNVRPTLFATRAPR